MPKAPAPRKCRYCGSPARKRIIRGRNKGWLVTCGQAACLKVAFGRKLSGLPKQRFGVCKLCGNRYVIAGARQKWCHTCVPSMPWRHRARRYGIGKPQWQQLLKRQSGHCALCKRKPTCVDHDHKSGVVRGLLCRTCNLKLTALDHGAVWLRRAYRYVERGKR